MISGGHPPQLLLLSTTASVGGVERIVGAVSSGLALRQWKVRTVFPDWADQRFINWCRAQGIEPELSPNLRKWGGLRGGLESVSSLAKFVRSADPDVVNLHYGGGHISLKDLIAVRRGSASRCVVSVHHPIAWSGAGPLKRAMTFIAGRLADAVIVPSRAVARIQREAGVPTRKIHVIPNGVREPDDLPTRLEARRILGLDTGALVIASLARLVPDKGIDQLIRAAATLPTDGAGRWVLAIAGVGPSRPSLEALARDLLCEQRCVFLGHVADASYLYAAADIVALPSAQEGFGLIFVEAALAGTPSIGTDVGGVPEVIEHERTGLLIPAGDTQGLAKAVHRLLEDAASREAYGTAARERALNEFSETRMLDGYERVLSGYPEL